MNVDRAAVEHVSRLAYVGLTADEIDHMTEQLRSVLDHVSLLSSVDTDNIPESGSAVPLVDVMRDDEVRPSWPPEAVLANAPKQHDGLFEVQAILD